jgi:hypothetical protein
MDTVIKQLLGFGLSTNAIDDGDHWFLVFFMTHEK